MQARQHHIEPIAVIMPVFFAVFHKGTLKFARFVFIAHFLRIIGLAIGKVIFIDKIVPRVIRRIDINHFHRIKIGFLQNFEDF